MRMRVPEEKKPAPENEGDALRPDPSQPVPTGSDPARLSFLNWEATRDKLVAKVRRSERLTKEDLAIRINATE